MPVAVILCICVGMREHMGVLSHLPVCVCARRECEHVCAVCGGIRHRASLSLYLQGMGPSLPSGRVCGAPAVCQAPCWMLGTPQDQEGHTPLAFWSSH